MVVRHECCLLSSSEHLRTTAVNQTLRTTDANNVIPSSLSQVVYCVEAPNRLKLEMCRHS